MTDNLKNTILQEYTIAKDQIDFINKLRKFIHELSPVKSQPVDFVRWVSINQVVANDYNPNNVAPKEMKLLYTSIEHDGLTQPIVTVYDPEKKKYIIVDGFHRYFTCRSNQDILDKNKGKIPIVVISKNANERMASTIRHNRARGEHTIEGMSGLVFSMLENGWKDKDICNELGMEADEIVRLKHITGFSKLFDNIEYNKAWKKKNQILLEKKYRDGIDNNNNNVEIK